MKINKQNFGKLSNGAIIEKIDLINNNNIKVSILSYGGIIQCIETPDEEGIYKDIVLGYDHIESYENDPYYMGAVVGPVAGRIKNAQFPLNGQMIKLEANAKNHQLHSGSKGLHKKVWHAETEERSDSLKVTLTATAADGESGFPGNRVFKTTYILNNKNQLLIYFDASSDADTVVNMTTHSYFNLSNQKNDTINKHFAMINAQKVVSLNDDSIPTGGIDYVLSKPYNFSRGKLIGDALAQLAEGIDHVYYINKEAGKFGISSRVLHKTSGRTLDIVTDQPALVFYTNNYPNGSIRGKSELPIIKHGAFCLEPQHFPDAPNHPHFPSITLKAGEKYKSRTQITFGLKSDSHHH
ncbi:MAG: galactose-1-epimerase [Bacteroidales bacterium]|nr:galactose-1-epimerase [Bacteroidales bacterium]